MINWDCFERRKPLVKVLFLEELVLKILSIYVPKVGAKDECYWRMANDGIFVKSAYFLAINSRWGSSGSEVDSELRKKMWGLKLPTKFALFLWKMMHKILPVRQCLMRRGMEANGLCPVWG